MVSEKPNHSQSRRRFIKTAGAATAAATFAVPSIVSADKSSNASFDPSDKDAVAEYIEWVDTQDNTIEQINKLSDEQVDAIGDVMTNISWSHEDVKTKPADKFTIQGYEGEDYVDKVVGSVQNTTTEYILKHRIDWQYNNGEDYKEISSTITADPHGALAEYVNGSKEVDDRVRKDSYFINRAKAKFRLVGVGRTVTAELDCKGNVYGDGETVKSKAPL
ncbi:twin-arginine translocation signal domain-containing protein [Haloferax mucosum]|nr:twin-arginine translocation signal domain-containing protein [Haloferax mucosum]